MSHTVFLSGSRRLGRLNGKIRERVDNILSKHLRVVVGDANGADKAFQSYLAEKVYPHVTVFCSEGRCRNNIGEWEVERVAVPPGTKGREFYTLKDVAMASTADCGLVLWDGESVGTINNILELLQRGKIAVVYFSPEQQFATLKSGSDLLRLLQHVDSENLAQIQRKVGLSQKLRQLDQKRHSQLELI
jgi:hypothetical protein